jgi:plastocyanin
MTDSNYHRWLRLPGLILVLLLTACGSSSSTLASSGAQTPTSPGQPAETADTIVIKNFMFQPASLTVSPGAVVTVRNEDSAAHTVTDMADPKLFSTGTVRPGQTRTFKGPDKPGSYPVFCPIHQFMTGELVVR